MKTEARSRTIFGFAGGGQQRFVVWRHMRILISACLLLNFAAGSTLDPSQQRDGSAIVVQYGTPVKLRLGRTVSSADAHVGDSVDFKVVEDVRSGDIPVIPRGSTALGTVIEAKNKHRLGRGGKLGIRIDCVRLADGSEVPLRATKAARGGAHTQLMAGAMVGTALIFLPAVPAFALMRGQDSVILKGTEVTAYVQRNTTIDVGKLSLQKQEAAAAPGQPSPALSQILDLLPTRVLDAQGNEGDMVNLLIVACREQLENAFEQASWIQVDRSKRKAALHIVKEQRSYREMPMSNLFLFGRSQDYGYAIAESMIARRHHLRIWKTDYEIDGCPVWVGAGTHDVGLEKNKHNWTLTHKIDPYVDDERDFIARSLLQTHLIGRVAYLSPSDSVSGAQTATGGSYHSDGRMLFVEVQ